MITHLCSIILFSLFYSFLHFLLSFIFFSIRIRFSCNFLYSSSISLYFSLIFYAFTFSLLIQFYFLLLSGSVFWVLLYFYSLSSCHLFPVLSCSRIHHSPLSHLRDCSYHCHSAFCINRPYKRPHLLPFSLFFFFSLPLC